VPVCMLIGVLNAISTHGQLVTGNADQNSLLSAVGKTITPVLAPLGVQQDNWPATVGLVTGMLAKEVVVGTLNTLYSQAGHLVPTQQQFNFWGGLHEAVSSIPQNLAGLKDAFINPIAASAAPHDVTQGVYGVMYHHFDGRIGAFAYLLFVLLYFPCISTMAVMQREVGKGWSYFSMAWSTGLAYGIATLFYQTATFTRHPMSSMLWIILVVVTLAAVILGLRYKARHLPTVKKPTSIAMVKRSL
jgi:ferrous iron transport protein B